jgi:hypothetical protein
VYETPLLAPRSRTTAAVLTSPHVDAEHAARHPARPDDRLSALAGRRIGVARGTNADSRRPRAAIRRAALEGDDREPGAGFGGGLARGDPTPPSSDPPATDAERALGTARVLRTELYAEVSLLVTRADVVTSHQRERLRPARPACGERAIRDDPEAALAHLRTRFPDRDDAALRDQLARVTRGLGLDNVLLQVFRAETAWLLRDSALARGATPDLERLIEPRLLDATDPESVMLLLPYRSAP